MLNSLTIAKGMHPQKHKETKMDFTAEQLAEIAKREKAAADKAAAATASRYAKKTADEETQAKLKRLEELEAKQQEAIKSQETQKAFNDTLPVVKEALVKQGGKATSVNAFMKIHGDKFIGKTPEEITSAIAEEKKNPENVDMFNNLKVEANKVVETKPETDNEEKRYYPGTSIPMR